MTDRTLPHNLEAERSILGSVLIEQTAAAYDAVGTLIQARHFFRDAHRRIFDAMGHLAAERSAVDLVTLKDELDRMSMLDEVGGPAYISSLVDGVPTATNIEYYAKIVREKAQLRDLIHIGNRIVSDAYEAGDDAEDILDRAERLVMEVRRASSRGEFILADDWSREILGAVEHAVQTRRVVTGVSTGLPTLDRMTRGFQPSDLIYLGARPATGKTSLAFQLALEASKTTMAAFISIEMSRKMLGFRAVALEACVDAFRLMTGHLTPVEQTRVAHAIDGLSRRRLAIDDASGQTATAIRAKVRRLASRYGLGIVFIDYMQLLRHPDGRACENRNLELSAISAGLKDLAKELDLPIVVLSQLSRDSSKSGNRRPQLHDLRDSGSLEQDADLVMLLHRPQSPDNEAEGQPYKDGDRAELIVAKQRNGPTGKLNLAWNAEQMRFGELVDAERVAGAA